jgi:carbonic anhydrase
MIDIIYRFMPGWRRNQPAPADAEEARHRLETGNHAFAELLTAAPGEQAAAPRIIPFDLRELGLAEDPGEAPTQAPFALVLGCSDARVPTELIFSQACNDLFVVRVAGNVLGSECLGSIDYALDHIGDSLKLLVVLGHSGCGAVTAAVDAFRTPGDYLSLASRHALRSVVDRLYVAVRAAANSLETVWGAEVIQRPGYRSALIETTILFNAALAAYTLHGELSGRAPTTCRVVYGVYDLVTHRVGLPAHSGTDHDMRLVAPPRDRAEFTQLAVHFASGDGVRRSLEALATG